MKKHNSLTEHRFVCPMPGCTESTTRKQNVKRHLMKEHDNFNKEKADKKAKPLKAKPFRKKLEGPFNCFNCIKSFASQVNLNLHDSRWHKVYSYLLLIVKYLFINYQICGR